MQNSMMVLDFSLLDEKHPFFSKFGPNHQNCQLYLKFSTKFNSNIQNSMVMFTFSVLNGNHPFWADIVQKIKSASLN